MKQNFLKNKKILITGGTGSIGSSLVFRLIKSQCKVLRVMSNDENGLYELSKEIIKKIRLIMIYFMTKWEKIEYVFF